MEHADKPPLTGKIVFHQTLFILISNSSMLYQEMLIEHVMLLKLAQLTPTILVRFLPGCFSAALVLSWQIPLLPFGIAVLVSPLFSGFFHPLPVILGYDLQILPII